MDALRTFHIDRRREITRLEDVAFERVCRDIKRHIAKYQDGTDEDAYFLLQKDYSDKILDKMIETTGESGFPEFPPQDFLTMQQAPSAVVAALQYLFGGRSRRPLSLLQRICPEGREMNIRSCLGFIFNKFLKRIDISSEDLTEDAVSVISQNCKELMVFKVRNAVLVPEIHVPLFKSIRNLTVMSLNNCGNLRLEIIEGITSSLVHLKVLEFAGTEIDNDGLYALCGHKLPLPDGSVPGCCFTNDCKVTSPLKLLSINITYSLSSKAMAACFLTHIPTLQKFQPHEFFQMDEDDTVDTPFALTDVIMKINSSREKAGMTSLTFHLEELNDIFEDIEKWQLCIPCCPRLKKLSTIATRDSSGIDQRLHEPFENYELKHLESFEFIVSHREYIFSLTNKFMGFFEKKGHQLRELHARFSHSRSRVPCSDLTDIIALCPNLKKLSITDAVLLETKIPEDLPKLQNLQNLRLRLFGEAVTVKTFCTKVILSAQNVFDVELAMFSPDKNYFQSLFAGENFPHLQTVNVYRAFLGPSLSQHVY